MERPRPVIERRSELSWRSFTTRRGTSKRAAGACTRSSSASSSPWKQIQYTHDISSGPWHKKQKKDPKVTNKTCISFRRSVLGFLFLFLLLNLIESCFLRLHLVTRLDWLFLSVTRNKHLCLCRWVFLKHVHP